MDFFKIVFDWFGLFVEVVYYDFYCFVDILFEVDWVGVGSYVFQFGGDYGLC